MKILFKKREDYKEVEQYLKNNQYTFTIRENKESKCFELIIEY